MLCQFAYHTTEGVFAWRTFGEEADPQQIYRDFLCRQAIGPSRRQTLLSASAQSRSGLTILFLTKFRSFSKTENNQISPKFFIFWTIYIFKLYIYIKSIFMFLDRILSFSGRIFRLVLMDLDSKYKSQILVNKMKFTSLKMKLWTFHVHIHDSMQSSK
jgi:hypothetical protein